MWRIDRQMTIRRGATTLTSTTLTSVIVMSRPPPILNADLRQSGPFSSAFKLGSPPTETGLAPIGLPQLASPPLDGACVYAFVGESKWLKTQRREEVNEVNTTETEKQRNGSFGGGESDERRNDEWNSGSSEGLVSSVTRKTWHDYQPESKIKLLSGERLGSWSAQKFDKRVRMRALVQGAANDARTRILLDTGANVSVLSECFAKQLRMREVRDHGRYFMIPAGVFLDLFHATAQLPDDVEIPLTKTQRIADMREEGPHVPDGPTEVWPIPGLESRDYRPMRKPPTNETHALWVRRTKELIPKVVEFRRGRPRRVRVTNISDRLVTCPVHLPLLLCVPIGDLPRTEGYVGLGSDKNDEWLVLAYSRSRDSDLYKDEDEIYQRWLAAQPSAVERVSYTTPTKILRRPSESSVGSASDGGGRTERVTATTEPPTEMETVVAHLEGLDLKPAERSDLVSEGSESNRLKLERAYLAAATVSEDWGDHDASNVSEHPGNDIEFEDYAREKIFLPDLTEAASTTLDFTGPHVRHPSLSVKQQDRVVKVLKSHEWILISIGNALSSAAYGRVQKVEAADTAVNGLTTDTAPLGRTRFEADREDSDIPEPQSAVVNDPRVIFGLPKTLRSSVLPSIMCARRTSEPVGLVTQLHHPMITNFVGLDETLQRVAPPSKRAPMVQMDPGLLYAHLPHGHRGFVLSFDGSVKTPKHGGASADSLAGGTLVAKEAKATLIEESNGKLEQLNRIHEVIYVNSSREVTQVSTRRTLSEVMTTQHDIFFDFALKPKFTTAITRQQTQTAMKRVRFAETPDEDPEAPPMEPEPRDQLNDTTTELSRGENGEIAPGAAERPPSVRMLTH
ncbi:unnamed protein product [Phytophthora fragariaefolia]|uniref:Unnamed protein product n=1 Tax=Phytophthora fragariaefolia TaxID=1490495 RepID=A0A9W6TLX9_9STRA|nr:unnamed protein product [Phytophthora fragariaefolia]